MTLNIVIFIRSMLHLYVSVTFSANDKESSRWKVSKMAIEHCYTLAISNVPIVHPIKMSPATCYWYNIASDNILAIAIHSCTQHRHYDFFLMLQWQLLIFSSYNVRFCTIFWRSYVFSTRPSIKMQTDIKMHTVRLNVRNVWSRNIKIINV